MSYPNCPVPPWTPEMQRLWNAAMLIERTRGAYGVGFPQPGTDYRPPAAGTFMHTLLFVATSERDTVEAHLAAVRENMEGWKARVRAAGNGKRALISTRAPDVSKVDVSKLEFKL
jgi:hypothetical protein